MKQLIPSDYCLRCDVCCRFPDNPTEWAPKFSRSEAVAAVEENLVPPELFSQAHYCADAAAVFPIQLLKHGRGFRCPCFSVSDNRCLIYRFRPFECQLYPFLLVKKGAQFFLGCDRQCLYIKSADKKQLQAYQKYLEKELKKKKTVSFLKRYRDLFVEYDSVDLELLFPFTFD